MNAGMLGLRGHSKEGDRVEIAVHALAKAVTCVKDAHVELRLVLIVLHVPEGSNISRIPKLGIKRRVEYLQFFVVSDPSVPPRTALLINERLHPSSTERERYPKSFKGRASQGTLQTTSRANDITVECPETRELTREKSNFYQGRFLQKEFHSYF
jgi:hypothetical protein